MRTSSQSPQRSTLTGRALRPACAAALLVLVAVTGCAAPTANTEPAATPSTAAEATQQPSTPAPEPSAAPLPDDSAVTPLAPANVTIASIDLSEPLIDLGITAEGDMEVPFYYDDVGWFTGGGRPGGHGPTVIAAHVDSTTGPGIFHRLHELRGGDAVEVTDAAGTVFRYVVTEVADYVKADFPTGDVFGATAADELRLITCGGVFDPASATYDENRVVYAERVAG
ncbi:class F sortase [Agrococcus sp. Marseille-P2731]|uniref:class F sortase n=1 Tax=Agrococcus sp. Marseille-P2731 TaxID=1841862 RepID=UPI0009F869E8|nr:class F sortase [Agrococcus sp. Marseille-P2731]